MLERDIRKKVRQYAIKTGWLTRKWVGVNNRGVPDDLFFKYGVILIVEFKATGKQPTPLQKNTHDTLRACGFPVHVIDNVGDGKALFDRYNQQLNYLD
jgi:hypothetical protein